MSRDHAARGRDGADLDHHPREVGHRPPLRAPVRAAAQDRDAGDREGPTTRRDALERAAVGAREPEGPRQHVPLDLHGLGVCVAVGERVEERFVEALDGRLGRERLRRVTVQDDVILVERLEVLVPARRVVEAPDRGEACALDLVWESR